MAGEGEAEDAVERICEVMVHPRVAETPVVDAQDAPSVPTIDGACAILERVITELIDTCDEYREILGDLVDLDSEERAMGRWPGFKERYEKAWARAREKFEP